LKPGTPRIKRQHLHDIRTQNRLRILQVLRNSELSSRQELAELLDLTPASLSRISKELIADGICSEVPTSRDDGQRGRPSVALQINAKGGYLIAISISSFARLISIIDIAGQRRYEQQIPKQVTLSGADTVAFIADYIDGLVADGTLARDLILGASLTIPGSINVNSGFLTKSVLLNWPEFPIKERLAERLMCPVQVENNGDALCRHFLESRPLTQKDHANVFLAHVSQGMGASIAIGGRIVRRLADEGWINDILVPTRGDEDQNERKLNELASGRAILKQLPDIEKTDSRYGTEFSRKLRLAVGMANETQDKTRDMFFDAGYVLGVNLVTLTIAIAPDTIVLAGPVLEAHAYSDGVRAGYKHAAAQMDIQPSQIVVSGASYIDASECLALHVFFQTGAYVA
jgi:predicted NBD/HSP70 family sugar kinase